jgi:hypothetical protein
MSEELKKVLDRTNKLLVKIQKGTIRFKNEIINHDKNHWSVVSYTEELIDGKWIRTNEKK